VLQFPPAQGNQAPGEWERDISGFSPHPRVSSLIFRGRSLNRAVLVGTSQFLAWASISNIDCNGKDKKWSWGTNGERIEDGSCSHKKSSKSLLIFELGQSLEDIDRRFQDASSQQWHESFNILSFTETNSGRIQCSDRDIDLEGLPNCSSRIGLWLSCFPPP